MYINENSSQMTLEGFYVPFAERLSPENRWVKLSRKMPWDKIEEEYLKNIDLKNGRPAISSRIAFGACFIRSAENITDERTVQAIAENPYMQYFLGLKEFDPEPLFDSSMMVHFRKRFPVNFVADVNEYLCTGKWPEDSRNVDRNESENDGDDNNNGTPSIELEPEEIDGPLNICLKIWIILSYPRVREYDTLCSAKEDIVQTKLSSYRLTISLPWLAAYFIV